MRPGAEAAGPGYPELDCLRGRIPARTLAAAETRADRVSTGADRVLIASGIISEEDYVRALAGHLGVAFADLDGTPRSDCLLSDTEMIAKAADGMLPLSNSVAPAIVVAPRRFAARQLSTMLSRDPSLAQAWRFTTSARLNRFILRCAGASLANQAADALSQSAPEFSAAPRCKRKSRWLAPMLLLALASLMPDFAISALEFLLAILFLGWLGLRLAGTIVPIPVPKPLPQIGDDALPVYTVVAALYREAASVDALLHAIARLDYPVEKLDVILSVEADDKETQIAIANCTVRVPVTVIPVPAGEPRTKPRALNAALPFAQGALTVIYDAEDRPDPDQLRRALHAFAQGGERLACVQARLTIDNTADSWLTRLFTAEYAGHFDVFLDGMAALLLPLPLGGSSNHFRTAILKRAGGWDAYNVTEDADLGLRLARLGFRTEMIASSTHEEAPAEFKPWLKQRTRWLKGWMQTWAVHMRAPLKLWRNLGPIGFIAVQLVIGGNVVAALVHPLFLAGFALALVSGFPPWHSDDGIVLTTLYGMNLLAGYLGSGALGYIGLARRGLKHTAWVLWLTPLHWVLLSLAAWRALWQFAVAPHLWEKTEHGLARHSRHNQRITAALLALEGELSRLEREGELPGVSSKSTARC
jgi:cellulose synthase/poly-beta-1,6-N-acetylglucosamine synthase-like glycosyltransferase